jgi:hypothetical protein
LHLDAGSSIDALLAPTWAPAAASSNELQQQQSIQQLLADAQLRTRDPATGRVVVQFETPRAAALALDAAAEVAAAANTSLSPVDVLAAAAAAAEGSGQQQDQNKGSAFAGGWLVDLMHAAVHRAIVSLS